ncbi:MAG: hypothetical protein P8L68_14320 [Paracoccaceae bacterium]|nr:hypothetical protein [Paracoccaceae bacterium]MDG2259657.1 hypothetical protein [Paracoccaceae bacterium]
MNRSIPMLLIGLVFGGLAGFLIAASNGVTLDGHDHTTDHSGETHATTEANTHNHAEVIHLKEADAPSIHTLLHADPAGGWNLEVLTENFRFSPENVSLAHIDGEGHAHVYVNGIKQARLYGNWMQLSGAKSGDLVSVSLNSNDHKALSVDGRAVSSQVTIP